MSVGGHLRHREKFQLNKYHRPYNIRSCGTHGKKNSLTLLCKRVVCVDWLMCIVKATDEGHVTNL